MRIQSVSEADSMMRNRPTVAKDFFVSPFVDLKDKSVVVLGNSPALNEVDLSLLDKCTTIGVNRICRAYRPTAVLFTDTPIADTERPDWERYQGPLITWHGFLERDRDSWLKTWPKLNSFVLGAHGSHERWVWPKTPADPIVRAGITPAYALQLAVLAGAKRVAILGVDMSFVSNKTGDTHFYGDMRGARLVHCTACRQEYPAVRLIRRGAHSVCEKCGTSNSCQKMVSNAGADERADVDLSRQHEVFFGTFLTWARGFGVDCYNLSPYSDTPIHKANWPKLTLEEFAELSTHGA